MSVRGNSSRITWAQRLIGMLVCLCLIAGLFPTPHYHAAQTPVDKDGSVPFPCQKRACGCKSAQQCWKKCCCFTNREKVAWAKTHRVDLPQFVVEAASQEPVAKAKACCLHKSDNAKQPDAPVFAVEAAKCQGDYWTWAVVSMWAVPAAVVNADAEAIQPLGPVRESKLIPCSPLPPVPPPRLGEPVLASA